MSGDEKSYIALLDHTKQRIAQARIKAALSVNREMILLYWEIGNAIIKLQEEAGWGGKVIERFSRDLKTEFTDMKGLSRTNLEYMKRFASTYPELIPQQPVGELPESNEHQISQQSVGETNNQVVINIPWGHNVTLLNKLKNNEQRTWYASKCIENGWSRSILEQQIKNKLIDRQGQAITNFQETLPAEQSDLAKETLKNPYVFDFLALGEKMQERDLENALTQKLKQFMLELGRGFAYVGRQVNIVVDENDYFFDLLFYNYHLNCFVVFELKIGEFKPEYAGKLNFYTNAIDEQIKSKRHEPTIGVLLCKTPNKTVVKYSLKGIGTPVGVAEYELLEKLPKEIKGEIPTAKELNAGLRAEMKDLPDSLKVKLEKIHKLSEQLTQEDIKEKIGPESVSKVFNQVLLPIKDKTEKVLQPVVKQFDSMNMTVWIGNTGFNTVKEAKEKLEENPTCREMRVEFRLDGFKKAGTDAFSCWAEVHITNSDFYYSVELNRHDRTTIYKMPYHKVLTLSQITSVANKISEKAVDEITIQLERLTKEQ